MIPTEAPVNSASLPAEMPEHIKRKLLDLCDRYEVNDGNWLGLALALAEEHEAIFQVDVKHEPKQKPNKDRVWVPVRYLFLWWDITEYKEKHKSKWKAAIIAVSQYSEWAKFKITREHWDRALKSTLVKDMADAESTLGREIVSEFMEGFLKYRESLLNNGEQKKIDEIATS